MQLHDKRRLMLSILCSALWGQAGGLSVGVFVGGMMMSGKHKYKREDVKEGALKKWYLNYLKNRKYPLIESEVNLAQGKLDREQASLKAIADLTSFQSKTNSLRTNLAQLIINDNNLRYYVSDQFKNKSVTVSSSFDLATTQNAYARIFFDSIGTLGDQDSTTYSYTKATGIYKIADARIATDRKFVSDQLTGAAKISAGTFASLLNKEIAGTPEYKDFDAAAADYRIKNITGNTRDPSRLPGANQGETVQDYLERTGKTAVKTWVDAKILNEFLDILKAQIENSNESLDDPLERALKAYQADQEVEPTAEQYDPNNENKALTSPELGKEPGEQGKWETLEGEQKSKRIGLTYGFSVGYEKEMNKNHAFVGGNAFAKKDSLTIKYNLQVEKGNRASFGELEAKPGYTFGVTVVAGKHLNPVFSVFGRGTFEFTKWGFTYDMKNDSPKMENDRIATQKLGNWVKQAAVGVGARYNFAPLWSVEACYDFIPATKTTVRDFNKLGDDGRRRGYIYTSSQHRAFLKVVRFFNM